MHGELDTVGAAEERPLLADDALPRGQLPRHDPAGERGGERDLRRALRCVAVHEQAFPHEHAPERFARAAFGFRFREHRAAAPGTPADLAQDGLSGVQVDDYGRQAAAFDSILHVALLFVLIAKKPRQSFRLLLQELLFQISEPSDCTSKLNSRKSPPVVTHS